MIFNAENVAEIIKIRQKIKLFYYYQRSECTQSTKYCTAAQSLQFALLLGCCSCWHGAFNQSLHNFDQQLSKYYYT
jgi:hypothetical protein